MRYLCEYKQIVDLIKLLHGKKEGIDKLVNSFHEQFSYMSKVQIKKRMCEIADKSKHSDGYGTSRYLVKTEFLLKHCPEVRVLRCFCFAWKKLILRFH